MPRVAGGRKREREKTQLKASVRTAQQPAVVVVFAGPCRPHHVSHGHRDHDAVLRLRGPAHCHTGHLMSQIKDRVRVRLDVPPNVEIKLGYAAGLGNIVSVSDDDTVEHVVQEIVQVHWEPNFISL